MNKKGDYLDWFIIILVVFMTAVSIIAGKLLVDKVDASGLFANNADAQTIMEKTQSTLLSFDNLMIFVIVGLSVFVLVSSAMVFNHPAYFIAGTFLLFIAVTIAATISNTFWRFTNSSTISATAAAYPKIIFLMNNIPLYIAFMGMAAATVMYVSWRNQ